MALWADIKAGCEEYCTVLPVSVSQTSAAVEYINQRGLRISVIQHKAPTSNTLLPSSFPSLIFVKNLNSTERETIDDKYC